MRDLIPPRESCPMCQGDGSMTYSGWPVTRCWGCSGKGHTRDWHTFQLAALQALALLVASAAGAVFVAFLHGDLAIVDKAMAALLTVTP
jgi:hypothetical protein